MLTFLGKNIVKGKKDVKEVKKDTEKRSKEGVKRGAKKGMKKRLDKRCDVFSDQTLVLENLIFFDTHLDEGFM